MTKIWINNSKGDKIIAIANDKLYKANPKNENVSWLATCIQANDFSDQALYGVRFDIIKSIQWQEGTDYLQVFYNRESNDHFVIKDDALREEIFNYLKAHIPNVTFGIDKYDRFRAARKPMAGLAVVSILLLYTIYAMYVLDSGGEVFTFGRIGGLIVGLISLGAIKVLLIYFILIAIAGYSTYKKMKNPPVVHVITLSRVGGAG